ncbi:MAG: Rieske (2Fe-2S) protein [Gemmatimonadota bacterium]
MNPNVKHLDGVRPIQPGGLPVLEDISRREFLALCGVGAGAMALMGCGGGILGPPDSVSLTLKVSDYPELAAVGGIALVTEAGGTPLAVVRTGTGTFLALSRVCPHAGGQIDENGSGYKCTKHGALFNAAGTWIGGQSTSSMRSYPASYDPNTDTIVIG